MNLASNNQAERSLANRHLQSEIQRGHELTRQVLAWRESVIAEHDAAAAHSDRANKRKRAFLWLLIVLVGTGCWLLFRHPHISVY